ncbi:MAG: hypothetical protein Faunusvirus3_38 [Faunusvirus sp.]|uniref:Uncharacterized protein n=1 Tax=Faunusvirus sp. TaxID=2487766 RepID=A0A3G4ZW79_9VIRU|nr:MAG: hypothetical protein Faunusvirus3_38 [Faunusvirus sp.]
MPDEAISCTHPVIIYLIKLLNIIYQINMIDVYS